MYFAKKSRVLILVCRDRIEEKHIRCILLTQRKLKTMRKLCVVLIDMEVLGWL